MIVLNRVTNHRLLFADYVMQRWLERGGADAASLIAHLENAVLWGAQRGEDVLFTHGDHVFPTTRVGGAYVVKTVLTKGMAVANMQSRGLHAALPIPVVQRAPVPKIKQADPTEYDPDRISRLAAEHAFTGAGRQSRYELLREAGINPNGAVGDVYRVAYEAAAYLMLALNAAARIEPKDEIPCSSSPTI